MKKIAVFGIRRLFTTGGAERHCEKLYGKLHGDDYLITIYTRSIYLYVGWHSATIKIHPVWTFKWRPLEVPIHSLLCAFLCIKTRPDVVHIHNIGSAFVVPLLRLFGLKVVVTMHSRNYLHSKWGRLARLMFRFGEWCLGMAHRVIVLTDPTMKYLIEKYNFKNVVCISNGIDIPHQLPIKHDEDYLLYVGRFSEEKGLLDLVKACNDLDYRVIIIGDTFAKSTPYKTAITQTVTSNNIKFHGELTSYELGAWYTNASLVIIPSYHEECPMVLLESLSFGRPVLVSDIEAHKEFALPSFRYFEKGNIDNLKSKIVYCYETSITTAEKKAYLELLAKKHNWDTIVDKTKEVYDTIR